MHIWEEYNIYNSRITYILFIPDILNKITVTSYHKYLQLFLKSYIKWKKLTVFIVFYSEIDSEFNVTKIIVLFRLLLYYFF